MPLAGIRVPGQQPSFPGPQPGIPGQGVFRVPWLYLTSPDFGTTLTIKLNYNKIGLDGIDPPTFRVYYLSPLDVGDGAIVTNVLGAKLSKQFVADLPSGTNQVSGIPYTPIGAEGSRRDYSLGGWMYGEAISGEGKVYLNSSSTSLVRVPLFNRDTQPADKVLSALSLSVTHRADGMYAVDVTFKNPVPVFGRTQYAMIFMYNYFNDALYRICGVYRLHGAPNDPNGQTVKYVLEPDGGGHNVIFYCAHANGARSIPFAKAINTYLSATQVGGFP